MSLIIAKKHDNFITIKSDTEVTFHDTKLELSLGKIKFIIVNPNLTISFAGSLGYASYAVSEAISITNNGDFEIDEIIDFLLETNKKSEDEVSFIICTLKPQKEIIKVQNSTVERDLSTAWIGNYEGFKKFQSHFLPMIKSGLLKKIGFQLIFNECFEEVLNAVETIGGLSITIVGYEKFSYSGLNTKSLSLRTGKNWIEKGIDPFEVDVPPNPAHGDYRLEFLSSNNGDSFGVYYELGNFGFFVQPIKLNQLIKIKGKTKSEFKLEVLKQYNVQLK